MKRIKLKARLSGDNAASGPVRMTAGESPQERQEKQRVSGIAPIIAVDLGRSNGSPDVSAGAAPQLKEQPEETVVLSAPALPDTFNESKQSASLVVA